MYISKIHFIHDACHKNIGIIIALVFVSWLEFTLVVLSQLRYNTAQLPVQTLNTIPERAFV